MDIPQNRLIVANGTVHVESQTERLKLYGDILPNDAPELMGAKGTKVIPSFDVGKVKGSVNTAKSVDLPNVKPYR